ncbi:hypothetical protein FRX31_012798 [Thalictrum thalictroides]|uniref:No apical meristem-associated C-terminal domain-containing protein n=1 Tax=Thalictrum thalictroides TaxID=46969 RepID=A0A7J6WME4_THATH|nr:hypothetical protein FRX31_012798 [Thalictrum thalictroides]
MEVQTSEQTPKSQSRRGLNFSAFEDEMLCKAWLETEKDPVVLSNQLKQAYWDRVVDTYNQLMGSLTIRTTTSLMSRWSTIQKSVGDFCGFLTQLETSQNSLTTLEWINEAKRVYHTVYGQPFKFENCWNLLKGTPKWEEYCSAKGNTKKAKSALNVDITTSGLGASSTPTTPSPTPSTPSSAPFELDVDPISLDAPCKERVIRRKVENERKNDECGQYMAKVDEANIVLKNFLSAFDARLQKSEEIALRELQLKEQKMLERKIEKEQKIMDMDLSSMPPMRRDYYLARQKEILARWTASGQFGGSNEGHSGLQSEENSGGGTV